MFGEVVDVVGDNHQVAYLIVGVGGAASIRYEECLDAQLVHHADGECYLLHGISLVIVETSLHGHDILAAELTEDELARMSFDSRYREVGDIFIRNLQCLADMVGQMSQSGAQYDGYLRMCMHPLSKKRRCFFDFF
jgi:hypothetical protein